MMQCPTAAAVVIFGHLRAGDAEVVNHVIDRHPAFGEVRHLGGPVIHLEVDVDRVFAAPCRRTIAVPDALQIGGLGTRAAGTEEQVPPELEIERRQCWIVGPGLDRLQPLVGGLLIGVSTTKIERHAVHHALKVLHMPVAESFVIHLRRPLQQARPFGIGIAGNVAEIAEACAGSEA